MPQLSGASLKILLLIIRNTVGWNKARDRINHPQFMKRTGLSRRAVSSGIAILENHALIEITDEKGRILTPTERRYQLALYYQLDTSNKAKTTFLNAKKSHPQRHSLPITIYSSNRQQKTEKASIKKQTDQERMDCLEKQQSKEPCSCLRCVLDL